MILELENFYWEEIESIEIIEDGDCYDLCVLEEDVYLGEPNYIAEDIVVHNSGMHEEFIARKHGKKKWSVPTVGDVDFINLMKSTYSVLVYQEQVMRYLSVVGKIPISQCQGVIKAISKKKVEKFQKYKDEFVKNAQITLNISHEEAVKEWENIESFASYGFNLAHSVAYTVASVRQLWQKSHYAIEFFVKDLAHLKTGDDRIQIYKDDAEAHGIRCRGLHLNNSDVNFSIVDKNGNRDQLAAEGDEIYYGFSKIKGIGEEVAKEIVKGQPYLGFVDFLNRFGTSANVVPALIALRVFKEADPVTLYKFYEVYKRDHKREVSIGDLKLGGSNPIRVQSMTTTDTMNTIATVEQSIRMIKAGCELVRITAPSINEAKNPSEPLPAQPEVNQ
jgi:DNA polymerase III alpha subunit